MRRSRCVCSPTTDDSASYLVLTMQQKLYHQTLAIRPKLIKLIEKYSQKKGMMIEPVFFPFPADSVLTPDR